MKRIDVLELPSPGTALILVRESLHNLQLLITLLNSSIFIILIVNFLKIYILDI
jgi:hypothetical protein